MGGTGEQSSGSDLLQGAAEGEEGDQGGHLQGISITTLLLFLGGIVFSRYGMDNHLLVKGQEREEVQYPLHHCLSKHFEVFEHLTRFMGNDRHQEGFVLYLRSFSCFYRVHLRARRSRDVFARTPLSYPVKQKSRQLSPLPLPMAREGTKQTSPERTI